MDSYTHISLNQEKQDNPVSQTRVSGFSCNGYISNSGCSNFQNWMFQFLLASFLGASIKAFSLPPLEAAGSTNENTHPKAFL
jgi:hypothetical protein